MDMEFMRDTILVAGAAFAWFVYSTQLKYGWWILLVGLLIWFTYDLHVFVDEWKRKRSRRH